MAENKVIDLSSLHKFRTEIPNIVLDIGLTIYEKILYLELKRIAGDSGKCFMSNSNLAKKCGMSARHLIRCKKSLSVPRKELNGKALIVIQEQKNPHTGGESTSLISITCVWEENFKSFCKAVTTSHTPMTTSHTPPMTDSQGVGDCLAHKEEPYKEEPYKEEIERDKLAPSPELFKYTSLESDQQRVVMPMKRYNKLVDKYGKDIIDTYMERLDRYADINPPKFKKYKNHAATISDWIERDGVIPVSRAKKESPPEGCAVPPLTRKPRSVEEVNLKSCRHAEKLGLFSGKKFKNCGHYLINLDNKKDVVFQMLPEAFVKILNDIFEFGLQDPNILMGDFDES